MKPRPDSPVVVVGRPQNGRSAGPFGLVHGLDPRLLLARRGWAAGRPVHALRNEHGQLVLEFAVEPIPPVRGGEETGPRLDAGLRLGIGEVPVVHQRVAAYGVLRSARGVLLTQLSHRTNAAGRWNLPGGGLEHAEDPLAALKREVMEESGQIFIRPRLLEIISEHWVGRSPRGRAEDFHAIRIIYLADVPEPTDPVVHDVGGSTEQARWFTHEELASVPVVPSLVDRVARWANLP